MTIGQHIHDIKTGATDGSFGTPDISAEFARSALSAVRLALKHANGADPRVRHWLDAANSLAAAVEGEG